MAVDIYEKDFVYPKIDTIFNRDEKGKIIEGEYSSPEIKYLQNNNYWYAYEKIHGTNMRVFYNHGEVTFHGREANSSVSANLFNLLNKKYTPSLMKTIFGDSTVCIYGEGYGKDIHKEGKYYLENSQDFIIFDIRISGWWVEHKTLYDIANKLNAMVVPLMGMITLHEAVKKIKLGALTPILSKTFIEGLVLKPEVQLFNRKGERIITKLKLKDYEMSQIVTPSKVTS